MPTNTLDNHLEELLVDPKTRKLLQRNYAWVTVASMIFCAMRDKGVSRTMLAGRMGVKKKRVKQWLGGQRDIRLSTLADIFTALETPLYLKLDEE